MCAPHKVNNKVAPSSLYPPVPDEIDGLSDRFKLLWFNHVSGLDAQQFKEYCEMQRTTEENVRHLMEELQCNLLNELGLMM